jgi:hypothetical protein
MWVGDPPPPPRHTLHAARVRAGEDDHAGLGGAAGSNKHDDEDEFERWIGCNHRLIYHYDHYVTARENIFLPCTIRGVRLMKVCACVRTCVEHANDPSPPPPATHTRFGVAS